MTDAQKQAIQQDVERAAQMKWTPTQMCPHPFSSEQGRYWTECYWAEWDKRYTRGEPVDGWGGEGHQEERRGK